MAEQTLQQMQERFYELSERVAGVERDATTNNREIRDLKSTAERQTQILLELKDMNLNIAMIAEQTKNLAIQIKEQGDQIKRQDSRLDEMERKPAKRWDQVVTAAITTIVGGVIGAVLALVIKK